MWEAKASDGRTDDLVAWALTNAQPGADVYRSADGRVVVIDATGDGLPEAPADLVARPPHVWSFERVTR
jgi:uncharacterized protein YijF (DUF1287 family)